VKEIVSRWQEVADRVSAKRRELAADQPADATVAPTPEALVPQEPTPISTYDALITAWHKCSRDERNKFMHRIHAIFTTRPGTPDPSEIPPADDDDGAGSDGEPAAAGGTKLH
jgi:hypothetical protein